MAVLRVFDNRIRLVKGGWILKVFDNYIVLEVGM